MLALYVAGTISRTQILRQARPKPTTSWLMEVLILHYTSVKREKLTIFWLGGSSGDGITLPGALDIECELVSRRLEYHALTVISLS